MAVLALGFVGAAIGGSIGGTILGVSAATIGGFIGSSIGSMVDNMLFPQSQEGSRLTDLTVTISSYGQPIPRVFGPENRITGNVIWTTGLIETKKVEHHGKGGPSVNVTTYTYRLSCAVLLGRGLINRVKKIWANGKLIYDIDQGGIIDSNHEDDDDKDTHSVFDTLTVYPGNFTQMPDPTIESYKGVGNVPAYRGTAYVVIKDLQLADYGNRLPNLEFLVEAQPEITVNEICRTIASECGIDTNTMSTIAAEIPVRGYVIGKNASGTAALQPLAMAFNFDIADVAGELRMVSRDSGMVAAIPSFLLAAHEGGSERPEPISWKRLPETTLPREAAISFADPNRDYQINTQTARREGGSAENNLATELAITMDVDHGRQIADRALWEKWFGRQTGTAQGDERINFIEPGRRYAFETPAGWEVLRVTRKARGANGVVELDLRRDQGDIYNSNARGATAAVPEQTVFIPSNSEFIPLDIPILLDVDDSTGFYYCVTSPSGWRGSDVMRALSESSDFEEVNPVSFRATVGSIALAMPDGPTDDFDDTTVVTVELRAPDMALVSVTDEQLHAGSNACFIGLKTQTGMGEICQFGVATKVGEKTYELSHWLRGRKGTEFATGAHFPAETFVLLEKGVIQRVDFGKADLDQLRIYKVISLLQSYDDPTIAEVLFTNTGVGKRPYSPSGLSVAGHQGTDLTLTWTRRSRLDSGDLGEASEAYVLKIMSAGTVKRQVNLTAPTFTYTAAMQTADFGASPITSLTWRVCQVSAIYGEGIYGTATTAIPA